MDPLWAVAVLEGIAEAARKLLQCEFEGYAKTFRFSFTSALWSYIHNGAYLHQSLKFCRERCGADNWKMCCEGTVQLFAQWCLKVGCTLCSQG